MNSGGPTLKELAAALPDIPRLGGGALEDQQPRVDR